MLLMNGRGSILTIPNPPKLGDQPNRNLHQSSTTILNSMREGLQDTSTEAQIQHREHMKKIVKYSQPKPKMTSHFNQY